MRANDIRQQFLEYFASKQHTVVPSSSLVPHDDPTLYFVNAGMVQFKDCFLGSDRRAYVRAASSQKCLRVSGKHNDLEAVGRTPRHHTLFEMLGNFSFGDYFKKEAIACAWELLTKVYKIPADRLAVTVFENDDEAAELWTAHIAPGRIFRMGEKDNFWAMGDTGPCGPCSEIYFDWHPDRGIPTKADVESDRFWEVWNLVFMQFDRGNDGTLTPLAKPSIDTGMGLERITAVLQQQESNYDTDLFTPIIAQIESVTGVRYTHTDAPNDVSIRVLADHIRATTFLIADGVLPSNEGRGYVLRRIMRRAIRHGKMLGMDAPFFHKIMPVLVDEMGVAYPDLPRQQAFVAQVILAEEERFFATLANGLAMLHETFAQLKKTGAQIVPGDVAFKLYDTFGFPKDLTDDIAAEAGFGVDHAGFDACMDAQRNQARAAWKGSGGEKVGALYQEVARELPPTKFVGYTDDQTHAKILAIVRDGARVTQADAGEVVELMLDCTPCYAESGGQVGDRGVLLGEGRRATILNTRKPVPTHWVHEAIIEKGALAVGDRVQLTIEGDRRNEIRKHHTATHLLHAALRSALGDHVKQAGSLVEPDRLRFDFAHFAAVEPVQLAEIERAVNREVQLNKVVDIQEQPKEKALARGAMAFFGDKYGDTVRVVEVPGYSIELCGGTHVRATGDIGAIKIVSESSVAAGVRRLEAVAGHTAVALMQAQEHDQRALAGALKVAPSEVLDRVTRLQEQVKQLERQLKDAKLKGNQSTDLMTQVREANGVKILAATVPDLDVASLRELADQYRNKLGSGIIALGTVNDDKASVIVMVTKDLTDRYAAGTLIQPITTALGGKGGGRPDMAQGGGPNIGALDGALQQLHEVC